MKESSYELLQSKKWRAITYDFEKLFAQGDTSRAYCLTDFQVAWLLSNTEYFAWHTRWENCPCTESDMLALKAEMEYNLMNCVDIQPYQVQYLYDSQQASELDALQALWDADPTPSAVNPLTPDDYYSGDGSQDRIDALCTACKIYVYSYAQNWVQKAQITLGIVAVVGLVASITIVGGIIASVLVGGLAYITSLALDAMQDTDALDEVACCMYNALNGATITNANFLTCLDGCSFTSGTNEQIARDIIASDLSQFKNWLTFINQIGDSFEYAENGIIDCPCEQDTWSHTFDFTINDGGWVARNIWGTGNCAVYSSGNGWASQDVNDGIAGYRRLVSIELPDFGDTFITKVTMHYNLSGFAYGSGQGSQLGLAVAKFKDTVLVDQAITNMDGLANGTNLTRVNDADDTADQLKMFLQSSIYTTAIYAGTPLITKVVVEGTGTNPF